MIVCPAGAARLSCIVAYKFPTFDEMRAIELAARRARNRELARLARLALVGIVSLRKRLPSGFGAKGMRHA